MGEAKQRKRAHAELLRQCPSCIYCGGLREAATVEHMPPVCMFDRKQRPKGLEFASCQPCNEGTKHADLIAALIGRSTPQSHPYQPDDEDWTSLCSAISNNIPGALEEMLGKRDTDQERTAKALVGDGSDVIHVNGPIVGPYMTSFSLKIGLALHYIATGKILPADGGISVRWFSNHEKLAGKFPAEEIQRFLGEPQTLRQGSKEVSEQFRYAWAATSDAVAAMTMSTFRFAFAVVAFTAENPTALIQEGVENLVYAPGDQLKIIAT